MSSGDLQWATTTRNQTKQPNRNTPRHTFANPMLMLMLCLCYAMLCSSERRSVTRDHKLRLMSSDFRVRRSRPEIRCWALPATDFWRGKLRPETRAFPIAGRRSHEHTYPSGRVNPTPTVGPLWGSEIQLEPTSWDVDVGVDCRT